MSRKSSNFSGIMVSFVQISILVIMLMMTFGFAIPKPDDDKKTRVKDLPLSDEEHYRGQEHNVQYDHDAFLGEEEARTFEDLSPDESKARLGKIVDKIDKDKDGFVTHEELRDWIQHTQKRYILDDVERQWKVHNAGKDKISWDAYKRATYGFMEDMDEEDAAGENQVTYKEMMRRDERRWKMADKDGDGSLSKEEFGDFLHPEEAPHMRDIVVQETMEDIDKDNDGKISMTEYIGDMYGGTGGDEEPDWVRNEREQFTTYRDKNNDGYMDRDEVRDWIIPPDYDHSEAEARHLVYESDANKDKKLTKEEILEKYDLFVGSQATDFGEALMRHDEF